MASWREKLYAAVGQKPPSLRTIPCIKCKNRFEPKANEVICQNCVDVPEPDVKKSLPAKAFETVKRIEKWG